MRTGFGRIAIIGALVAAFVAAVANMKYLQGLQETRTVVVAKREVQAYEKLDESTLEEKVVPASTADGALDSMAKAKDRFARGLLVKGQMVREEHLTKSDTGSIAARLTDAKPPLQEGAKPLADTPTKDANIRAMALKVSVDTGVANTLKPGDQVDVLVSLKLDTPTAQGRVNVAKIIANRVPVIYTTLGDGKSDSLGGNTSTEGTVVLQVQREQAEELAFAQTNGTIWLLTAPFQEKADRPEPDTKGMTVDSFLARHGLNKVATVPAAKGAGQ